MILNATQFYYNTVVEKEVELKRSHKVGNLLMEFNDTHDRSLLKSAGADDSRDNWSRWGLRG
jgi:hypothetical protein